MIYKPTELSDRELQIAHVEWYNIRVGL